MLSHAYISQKDRIDIEESMRRLREESERNKDQEKNLNNAVQCLRVAVKNAKPIEFKPEIGSNEDLYGGVGWWIQQQYPELLDGLEKTIQYVSERLKDRQLIIKDKIHRIVPKTMRPKDHSIQVLKAYNGVTHLLNEHGIYRGARQLTEKLFEVWEIYGITPEAGRQAKRARRKKA